MASGVIEKMHEEMARYAKTIRLRAETTRDLNLAREAERELDDMALKNILNTLGVLAALATIAGFIISVL